MDVTSIVPNVNWFMSVPVLDDGSAGVAEAAIKPGSLVKLRAECNVLAVLSNCPQMHNPCNAISLRQLKFGLINSDKPKLHRTSQ